MTSIHFTEYVKPVLSLNEHDLVPFLQRIGLLKNSMYCSSCRVSMKLVYKRLRTEKWI